MSILDGLVDNVLTAAQGPPAWAVGTVTAVAASGSYDGFDLVTVDWRGTNVQVQRCASYTPAAGDRVLMARFGPQLIVIDRIVGTPPRT